MFYMTVPFISVPLLSRFDSLIKVDRIDDEHGLIVDLPNEFILRINKLKYFDT